VTHDPENDAELLRWIRNQASAENILITQHARQEMADENVTFDDVLQAVVQGTILENYPRHRRGPCCLLGGTTQQGRPLHVVCTTTGSVLILITVYEPTPPKWITPTQRRQVGNGMQH
jgi:hypothetical protein